jgi:hypothetical protein
MGPERNTKGEKRPYSEWNELRKAFRSIYFSFPHVLSHHPHCKYYDKDVLHIGKWRFCWGCIVTYPVMVLCILFVLLLGLNREFPWWQFVIAGTVFGGFELISLWRKGRGLRHRTIKTFLGLGLGLMTIGVFSIPIHLPFRLLIYLQLYLIAGFFGSLRILAMEKKCQRCGWKGNWNRCPGFEEMNARLEEKGLLLRR